MFDVYLETVDGLLSVPDGPWRRVPAPNAVLVDGTERPLPRCRGLGVERLVPEPLQTGVVGRRETVRPQHRVHVAVTTPLIRHLSVYKCQLSEPDLGGGRASGLQPTEAGPD